MKVKLLSINSVFDKKIPCVIQKYNHEKYWHGRKILIDANAKVSLPIKLCYLYILHIKI